MFFRKKNRSGGNGATLEKALEREEAASLKAMKASQSSNPPAHNTAHQNAFHKAVFSWEALEYVQHEKSPLWYKIAAFVLVFMVAGSIFFGNWTLAAALVTFGAVYFYMQKYHPPKRVPIIVSEMGIKVGTLMFPFSNIEAFWILYHPPVKTLNLRIKNRYSWDLVIQLEHEDPVEIRRFLCGQIPEWEGKTERFSDTLLRLFKL